MQMRYDGPKWPKPVFLSFLCKYAKLPKIYRIQIFRTWPKISRKLRKMSGNCRKSYFSRNFRVIFARFRNFPVIFGKFPQDPRNREIRKISVTFRFFRKPRLGRFGPSWINKQINNYIYIYIYIHTYIQIYADTYIVT